MQHVYDLFYYIKNINNICSLIQTIKSIEPLARVVRSKIK